jgi:hypothetical protein
MNHEFQFLNFTDFKYFSESFNDFATPDSEMIPFTSLREIVNNYNTFNRNTAADYLDRFLKQITANLLVTNFKERNIYVSKNILTIKISTTI